ncbi:hypothetical protein [Pelagibacterium lentulum]|uniref:Uncharacterized protein n=1 Tax=Pelagibacterium lentulum TaxID=2029865 RepID=A0A916R4F7_9HYPH|nr:hypothetical protein [Pelagibacterium lentulum]GGA36869.1 hypothetical protein GCM10011499_02750 [Pelagibacterium lentulum]
MPSQSTAARIGQTVKGLETTTRFALAVLALASGVYTYLGVRGLLDGDANFVFFAAIIYSAAVSVGIYVFWSYMMRLLPLMREMSQRLVMIAVMLLGSVMIIAMSSWLNAAALAGSAALEQHMAVTLEDFAGDLDQAHANALSAQSLLPDVQRASERFSTLAAQERDGGALTGAAGAGSVVQLLSQMSSQLTALGNSITASQGRVADLFETGTQHLAAMRELVSASGPVQPRADRFAEELVNLTGVIAALQETSVAPSVRRAAEDLSLGFIAPVADGQSASLVFRQDQAMANIRSSVEAQSAALAQAADEILSQPAVEPRRFVPLSTAEAVLRYASDFLPSWAGAISIDLLPVVLVLLLAVAHSAMRRDAASLDDAESLTAADMMRAVALHNQMLASMPREQKQVEEIADAPEDNPAREPEVAETDTEAHDGGESETREANDDTVTPLPRLNPRKRSDGPARS